MRVTGPEIAARVRRVRGFRSARGKTVGDVPANAFRVRASDETLVRRPPRMASERADRVLRVYAPSVVMVTVV